MSVPSRRILVVDDAPDFLAFVDLLLTGEGYEILAVASADEARAALAAALPHLVICDVRMPGSSPFAVLDMLRSDPVTAALPVLLCTGAVHDIEQAGERVAGPGIEVLFKPFDIDALFASIKRLMPEPIGDEHAR